MVRAGFLFLKFRMQPFNYRFLIILGVLLITLFAGYLMQDIGNWIARTAVICVSIVILYLMPILLLRLSDDLNNSILRIYRQIREKLF